MNLNQIIINLNTKKQIKANSITRSSIWFSNYNLINSKIDKYKIFANGALIPKEFILSLKNVENNIDLILDTFNLGYILLAEQDEVVLVGEIIEI